MAVINSIIISTLIASMLLIPISAFSHLDPPSPHKHKVTVTLDSLQLLEDQDDGIDGNAEVTLSWSIVYATHDKAAGIESIDNLDFDPPATTGQWNINKVMLTHIDCEPLEQIVVNFQVVEGDQLDPIITQSIGILTSEAAKQIYEKHLDKKDIDILTAILNLFPKLISLINGDDDKGSAADVTNIAGQKKTTVKGADGGAEITWTVKTERVPDPNKECDPLLPLSPPSPQPSIKEFFDTVRTILKEIPNSMLEPGIDDITDEEFQQLKAEAPNTIMKNVDSIVLTYIQLHKPTLEVDQALKLASNAKSLALAGNFNKSLELYEEAMNVLAGVPIRDEDSLVILDAATINIGEPITVTAITVDPNIKHVKFEWIDPTLDTVRTTIDSTPDDLFTDSFKPKTPGTWFVKAELGGSLLITTIYVKFFQIPESTIGIMALISSPLAVLGYWVMRHRRTK